MTWKLQDRRSAGGHGNQHVRLRGAQIDYFETICPVRSAVPHRAGQASFQDFELSRLRKSTSKTKTSKHSTVRNRLDGLSKRFGLCCTQHGHAKPANVAVSPKIFILFRSGANALPSRASFPIPDRVKIPASNTEKWTVLRNHRSQPGGIMMRKVLIATGLGVAALAAGARQGRRGVGQASQGSEAVGHATRR